MNICCSCERTVKESYDYLIEKHNTYLQYIPLPFELRYEIGKFLIRSDSHIVTYTVKSRVKPEFMDYDSDGEYYWDESKTMCTLCFQLALAESLCVQNHLPRFRRDKWYFIVRRYYSEEPEEQYEKYLENFYLNYYLPKTYFITWNRQLLPSEHPSESNRYIIYSNN
jgi:hypothetical protein